jgi:hypothetical protein
MNFVLLIQSGEQVVSSEWPASLCVLANYVKHFLAKDLKLAAFWTAMLKTSTIAAKMRMCIPDDA